MTNALHNIAPEGDADVMLAHEIEAFLERCERLSKDEADETTQSSLADLVATERRLRKALEQNKDVEKRPLLEATRAIDAKFNMAVERLTKALHGPREKLKAWMLKIEAERAAAAKAAREAAEAATAAASATLAQVESDDPFERLRAVEAAPNVDAVVERAVEANRVADAVEESRTRVSTYSGRAIGLKTVRSVRITDYQAALATVAEHPDVKAAVLKALTARAKADKWQTPLPGCVFDEGKDLA